MVTKNVTLVIKKDLTLELRIHFCSGMEYLRSFCRIID